MKKKTVIFIIITITLFSFTNYVSATEKSTLIRGVDFNSALSTYCADNGITELPYIVFGQFDNYQNNLGEIEWNDSSNVSVSSDGNTKLIQGSYNNETAVFVLTNKDVIEFNSNSSSMFSGGQVTGVNTAIFRTVKGIIFNDIDTSNVTKMFGMFSTCISLTTLDLSSFDTSKVTNMNLMFTADPNLKTIYVSTFDTSSVEESTYMFLGTFSLVGGMGTAYDESYDDKTYARIDNAPDEPGYFSVKSDPIEPDPIEPDPDPIEPEPDCTGVVKGDWNGDGKFTDSDAVYYIKYIAEAKRILDLYDSFNECKKKALNWVGDTKIEDQDVIQVIKYLAHLK